MVAILAAVALLGHDLLLILGPERRLMEWLYDDCFYYIITAWHFSLQGISSFDGVTRTSGYHPLWMWVCAGLVRLHPTLDLGLLRLCVAFSALLSGSLLVATLLWALRGRRSGWLWALALAASSYSAWNNSIAVMEWPLVLISWTFLHLLLLNSLRKKSVSFALLLGAFVAGVLLTLSRTDSGLIPLCYTLSAYLQFRRTRISSTLFAAVAALAGSVAGLAATLLYNHAFTGAWLQQSARIKELFASVTTPFNPIPAIWQFLRILLFLPRLELTGNTRLFAAKVGAIPASLILIGCLIWIATRLPRIRRFWASREAAEQLTLTAAVLGIVFYVGLYSLNSMAMYGWYTAPVTGFVLCIAASCFARLRASAAASIVLPLLLLNFAGYVYGGGNAAGQYQEVLVGKYLRDHIPMAVLAGGDVGKPAFYNRGAMFNTDGLMNNEIVPYLESGRYHCYLLKRGIEYTTGAGSITSQVVDKVRERHGQPPLPWPLYVTLLHGTYDGMTVDYYKVNPQAIRDSGECPEEAAGSASGSSSVLDRK
ncbi:hypothetical protein [Terriglobus roseus]|uniref:hypothetical protein n=1 Tax=Terriglobus roseus TaxID=392734 RepID=UPI000941CD80|nr:hypothetical protein [Terriglobus roseus]